MIDLLELILTFITIWITIYIQFLIVDRNSWFLRLKAKKENKKRLSWFLFFVYYQ